MTLEDFFTLTEMKDGLTAPMRVEELITVMKKEKDYVVKNIGEMTRHWATVASTIATTENKECLDLFIQLDGLWYFNKWLKDAQIFCNNTSDNFVEESIIALLQALKRLNLDYDKLFSSGIGMTVKNLRGHNSSRVQDGVKSVIDSWNWIKDKDEAQNSESKEIAYEGNLVESIRDENLPSKTLDDSQIKESIELEIENSKIQDSTVVTLDHAELKDVTQENIPIKENPPIDSPITPIDTCNVLDLKQGSAEDTLNVQNLLWVNDDGNSTGKIESSSKYPVATEILSCCSTLEDEPIQSRADTILDAKNTDINVKSEAKSEIDNALIRCRVGNAQDQEITFSRTEDIDVAKEKSSKHDSDEDDEDMSEGSDIIKLAMDSRGSDVIDRTSDTDLEYGVFDALKVARQVANAVEREVNECGKPFLRTSSLGKISENSSPQPRSTESINRNDDKSLEIPENEVFSCQNLSIESSSRMEGALENDPDTCSHDIEPSHMTGTVHESEKGVCNFDLNQDMSYEDADPPLNTIAVVSALRAPAGTGLPTSPLQFEGTLGWKGSAATSAFRVASPRKSADGEKISTVATSPKQRNNVFGFDLNVAEEGDDQNDLPSGDSSVVVSSRKSERLKLDLNLMDDVGDAPISDWRVLSYDHRNGHRSPSPPSTSSSSMQPFLKNFDLNDRPSTHNDLASYQQQPPYFGKLSSSSSSSQYENAYGGGLKPIEPVISILGTKVEVNKKDYVPQFMPMKNPETTSMDFNMSRFQAMSYSHLPPPPGYGYNGLSSGPPPSMSYYAPGTPIPYMVDSRGSHVVPHIMGYAPVAPPYTQQQHFIASMHNGPGPIHTNLDLNSGFIGGNRDVGVSRQFFPLGPVRSMEEHFRADLQQPSSSSGGNGGKRKEPDSGWEPYPFNMKHWK